MEIKVHLKNHLRKISKDRRVTEKVWKIMEPKKGSKLEDALQPKNFTRTLKENGYKTKVYRWGSGSHASNQLYQVEIKVTQQDASAAALIQPLPRPQQAQSMSPSRIYLLLKGQ